jgi:tRNA (guanine-N7-)-methyltransferase
MRVFSPDKVPIPKDFMPFRLDPNAPLDVEIGCGVGFHPLRYARLHPERQLIAFERTSEKFAKFQGRLARHEPLPNLLAIHGDAIAWIAHGLKAEQVDRYFLLYPNPYPKESQRNLRFHEMPFFSHLLHTMKPSATLTLATNERFYAESAREALVGRWGMKLLEEAILGGKAEPRTHFEKKYLARGDLCWNFEFKKP